MSLQGLLLKVRVQDSQQTKKEPHRGLFRLLPEVTELLQSRLGLEARSDVSLVNETARAGHSYKLSDGEI